jgi:ubiquinone/menaquinone biosynthesis C-methylase UbiE
MWSLQTKLDRYLPAQRLAGSFHRHYDRGRISAVRSQEVHSAFHREGYDMRRWCGFAALTLYVFLTPPLSGQEKSVRPGINKPFEDPDVPNFINTFEKNGREIYDFRKEIVEACKLKPGTAIADIGAGTGLLTRMFAPAVGDKGKVYAVDIAQKFLDHIKKTCDDNGIKNVSYVKCTATSVELPENSIDVAFICDTYHHFEFPAKTMASIHKALKPGGHVVLIDFHRIKGQSTDWVMGHVRAGQEVFAKEVEESGFKQVEEKKFMKQSYFLRFKKIEPKK